MDVLKMNPIYGNHDENLVDTVRFSSQPVYQATMFANVLQANNTYDDTDVNNNAVYDNGAQDQVLYDSVALFHINDSGNIYDNRA